MGDIGSGAFVAEHGAGSQSLDAWAAQNDGGKDNVGSFRMTEKVGQCERLIEMLDVPVHLARWTLNRPELCTLPEQPPRRTDDEVWEAIRRAQPEGNLLRADQRDDEADASDDDGVSTLAAYMKAYRELRDNYDTLCAENIERIEELANCKADLKASRDRADRLVSHSRKTDTLLGDVQAQNSKLRAELVTARTNMKTAEENLRAAKEAGASELVGHTERQYADEIASWKRRASEGDARANRLEQQNDARARQDANAIDTWRRTAEENAENCKRLELELSACKRQVEELEQNKLAREMLDASEEHINASLELLGASTEDGHVAKRSAILRGSVAKLVGHCEQTMREVVNLAGALRRFGFSVQDVRGADPVKALPDIAHAIDERKREGWRLQASANAMLSDPETFAEEWSEVATKMKAVEDAKAAKEPEPNERCEPVEHGAEARALEVSRRAITLANEARDEMLKAAILSNFVQPNMTAVEMQAGVNRWAEHIDKVLKQERAAEKEGEE